jgi:hypothetical protein
LLLGFGVVQVRPFTRRSKLLVMRNSRKHLSFSKWPVAGVSGKTVEKIAAVTKAAKVNPKEYGHLPEQMDKTGKVDAAYRQFITGSDGKKA